MADIPDGWTKNEYGSLVPPSKPIDIRTPSEREFDSIREELLQLQQRVRRLEILLHINPSEHDDLRGLAAREVGTWEKP